MWLALPNRNPAFSDLVESWAELSWLLAAGFVSCLTPEFQLANLLPYASFYFLCGLLKVFFQLISIERRFLLTWMLRYKSGLPLNRAGMA